MHMKIQLTVYDMHVMVPLTSALTHIDTTDCLFMHNVLVPLTVYHLHMKISLIDYHIHIKVPLTVHHLNT